MANEDILAILLFTAGVLDVLAVVTIVHNRKASFLVSEKSSSSATNIREGQSICPIS